MKIGWKTCINYFHLSLSLQPYEVHMLQSTKWNEWRKQRKMEKKEKKYWNRATGPNKTRWKVALFKWSSLYMYLKRTNAHHKTLSTAVIFYPPPNHSSKAFKPFGLCFKFVHQNVYPFFIIVCQFTAPMSFWKLFVFHRRFLSLLGRETVTFNTRS